MSENYKFGSEKLSKDESQTDIPDEKETSTFENDKPLTIGGFPNTLDINEAVQKLKNAGFGDPYGVLKKFPHLAYYNVKDTINDLNERGFKNPIRMIEKCPQLVEYDLDKTIKDLGDRGFKDPFRAIERFPQLAGLDMERVITSLREAGIKDPIRVIEKHPQTASIKIKDAVDYLKKIGIKNPAKVIERFPQLTILDIEKAKKELENIGFKNSIDAIERYPQLASFDIERIKNRVKYFTRLVEMYNLDEISPVDFIEGCPTVLGYNKYRLSFHLKILQEAGKNKNKEFKFSSDELLKKGKALFMINPYLILHYLQERDGNEELNKKDLNVIIQKNKTLEKDRKKKIIDTTKEMVLSNKENLDDEDDIFLRKLKVRLCNLEESKAKFKRED